MLFVTHVVQFHSAIIIIPKLVPKCLSVMLSSTALVTISSVHHAWPSYSDMPKSDVLLLLLGTYHNLNMLKPIPS